MAIRVDVDNFVRAETDRMFAALQAQAGGVNRFSHDRAPAPVDQQPVIRMNRDTLYSMAVVDLASGATLTVPDAGRRYLSVMVVNQDHYINRVFHSAGTYPLTQEGFDTRYVAVGWGGLPDAEAKSLNVDPGLPVGDYRIRVADVPVDAFWSISIYNQAGFFEPNDRGTYSINSTTGVRDPDGAITVHLGSAGRPNEIPITDGWNYIARLYRPRAEILDGSWTFPAAERIG